MKDFCLYHSLLYHDSNFATVLNGSRMMHTFDLVKSKRRVLSQYALISRVLCIPNQRTVEHTFGLKSLCFHHNLLWHRDLYSFLTLWNRKYTFGHESSQRLDAFTTICFGISIYVLLHFTLLEWFLCMRPWMLSKTLCLCHNLLSHLESCSSAFQTGGMMHTHLPFVGCHTSIWALLAFGGTNAQWGIGTFFSKIIGWIGVGSLTSRARLPRSSLGLTPISSFMVQRMVRRMYDFMVVMFHTTSHT